MGQKVAETELAKKRVVKALKVGQSELTKGFKNGVKDTVKFLFLIPNQK